MVMSTTEQQQLESNSAIPTRGHNSGCGGIHWWQSIDECVDIPRDEGSSWLSRVHPTRV